MVDLYNLPSIARFGNEAVEVEAVKTQSLRTVRAA
jgi:hypothetical protein